MKKLLFLILFVMLVSLVACKPTVKSLAKLQQPAAGVTSDVAESIGKDLNNIENAQKDLNSDALSDFGSSLDDIQKI